MANISFKTIQFPGLSNVYTVPQIDNTNTIAGKAADAKKTGDDISQLQADLDDTAKEIKLQSDAIGSNDVTFEKGYWAITNGGSSSTSDWMKTPKYISEDIDGIYSTADIIMYLQAWDKSTDVYAGTWNGSAFTTTYIAGSGVKTINLNYFREDYPDYKYTISAISEITPARTLTPATDGKTIISYKNIPLQIAGLKNDILNTQNSIAIYDSIIKSLSSIEWLNGYWSIANGGGSSASDWMRSGKFLSEDIHAIISNQDIIMYLQAWNKSTDAYIGTWNGTAFTTTYIAGSGVKSINLANFREDFPDYKFTISAISEITPARTLNPTTDGKTIDVFTNVIDSIERLTDVVSSIPQNYFLYSVNHRGYSTSAPENTLPAYILSKQKGFEYVECDVEFTSDGVAVLLHDSTINRTARNADGTSISETTNINDITYAEALTYDFGVWKGTKWTGTKIPTFDEFILLCKQLSLHPFIELKDSVNGNYWTDSRIQSVAESIKKVGMERNVSFISFSINALNKIKTYFPEARLGLGFEGTYSVANFETFITNAVSLVDGKREVIATVSYAQMTDTLYDMLVDAEINPFVWTVNTQEAILSLDETVVGVLSDVLNAGRVIIDNLFESLPQ